MIELKDTVFRETFGSGMKDITQIEVDNPIDIWAYIKILVQNNIVGSSVLENEIVEKVYRNNEQTFDHILLSTDESNVFLTIVVDLNNTSILGFKFLNLNNLYGLDSVS